MYPCKPSAKPFGIGIRNYGHIGCTVKLNAFNNKWSEKTSSKSCSLIFITFAFSWYLRVCMYVYRVSFQHYEAKWLFGWIFSQLISCIFSDNSWLWHFIFCILTKNMIVYIDNDVVTQESNIRSMIFITTLIIFFVKF